MVRRTFGTQQPVKFALRLGWHVESVPPRFHLTEARLSPRTMTSRQSLGCTNGESSRLLEASKLCAVSEIFAGRYSGNRNLRQPHSKLLAVNSGKVVVSFEHQSHVFSAEFSPEGSMVVTASHDGTAQLWDARTGNVLAVFEHQGVVNTAEFSQTGRQVITASNDMTARIWDIAPETRPREQIRGIVVKETAAFRLGKGFLFDR